MAAQTSLHSNANNFLSAMQAGVNPRTGLYSISVNLGEIIANGLRGPGFQLALGYSPLSLVDSGWGLGWDMQLSQYTLSNQVLSLSTGESFKVTGTDGNGQLLMKEKKLDTFHFYEDTANQFRVVHKSGMVEILEVKGSLQNRVAVPTRIYSPVGNFITLEYTTFAGVHQLLTAIRDEAGLLLMSVKRTDFQLEVMLLPLAGPGGTPWTRFVMELATNDRRVSRIVLPDDSKAAWRFDYLLKGQHLCITQIETPGGSREQMFYNDAGHQYPTGNNMDPLPRITEHRLDPGAGQPLVRVGYSYPGVENFLGGGRTIAWDPSGLDNLYTLRGRYQYTCVEKLMIAGSAVRTIEYTYNQFHLLTEKTTTQNNHVQIVRTEYFVDEDKSFDAQPNYFQLPRQVTTLWTYQDNVALQRSETATSTYDIHGNPLTQTLPNGVVETNTWLPPSASDPEGFVRHLKERTVTPAPSAPGDAPTLCTRYTYKALTPLGPSPLSDYHTVESETLLQLHSGGAETELQRMVYSHIDDPDDAFLHGRVSRATVTLNGMSTFNDYLYEKLDSPEFQVPVLQTTQTTANDFDSTSRSSLQQQSLLTGQTLLSRYEDIETRSVYDNLGRLVEQVVGLGTPYEARRRYESSLSTVIGEQLEQRVINARNITARSVLDGFGRVVYEERDHVDPDNPTSTRQTSASKYNEWGDIVEATAIDWLDGVRLEVTSRQEYDDWGEPFKITGPDGVIAFDVDDPIGTQESDGPIVRSWLQSRDGLLITGLNETWLNRFGKPSRIRALNAAGDELSKRTYQYDGLGNCIEETDENNLVTRYSYDAFSRLTRTLLPDNTIVKREYAPHSAAELAVTLSSSTDGVRFTQVGEREFDGLDRLTRMTTGTRTERYTYEGGREQLQSLITPANETIRYDYNLPLSTAPIASQAPDENASFSYDNTSARLTRASNELGTREYDYNTSNQLTEERWIDTQGKTWQSQFSHSMNGALLKRTDLKQGNDPGLDTVHHYDTIGRLIRTLQGGLEAGFSYDGLGQLSEISTRDLNASSQLTTRFEYDDQGQECLRTMVVDQQVPQTQEQTWRADGLLDTRHLKQGAVSLLEERFGYDLRGRLTEHYCSGATLPHDELGREYVEQIFNFNEFDSLTLITTRFSNGQSERAFYSYSPSDPCLLQKITYNPTRPTGDPTFSYDLNGNQSVDEQGRLLTYDSQNRLVKVEDSAGQLVSEYRYDGHSHLVNTGDSNGDDTLRFYKDEQLNAIVKDDRQTQLLYLGDHPLGQQEAGDPTQTLLLMTGAGNSVIGESQQQVLRTAVYGAYGDQHSDQAMQSLTAFNGEVLENAMGWYLLGRGYRAYNPVLKRFHSPDSLAPFDGGGINPYCYCLGNPIALRDPTGHQAIGFSGRLRRPDEDAVTPVSGGSDVMSWIFVAVGVVGTVAAGVATVLTAGKLAPLFGKALYFTIAKTAALAASTVTGAAATAFSADAAANDNPDSNTKAGIFGLVSLVTGIAAVGFGMAASFFKTAGVAASVADSAASVRSAGSISSVGSGSSVASSSSGSSIVAASNRNSDGWQFLRRLRIRKVGNNQPPRSGARAADLINNSPQTAGRSASRVPPVVDDAVASTSGTSPASNVGVRPPVSQGALRGAKANLKKTVVPDKPAPSRADDLWQKQIIAAAAALNDGNVSAAVDVGNNVVMMPKSFKINHTGPLRQANIVKG